MRNHKKSLMTILVQKYSFTNETKRTLKKITDYVMWFLLVFICLVDWDKTLEALGL